MTNEIISYQEMCLREGMSLQRGMNFRSGGNYSIILMSRRPNAPYNDRLEDGGTTLIYEDHDVPRNNQYPDPKVIDQQEFTKNGALTENGKFYQAAINWKKDSAEPEKIKVYEKIKSGIWSYNGMFDLMDSWVQMDGTRNVFKFKLTAVEEDSSLFDINKGLSERRRIIPSKIKLHVWKRDGGKCVICGAQDELQFDHIIPYSKGGTSIDANNIQLLCARHNIEKRDNIE